MRRVGRVGKKIVLAAQDWVGPGPELELEKIKYGGTRVTTGCYWRLGVALGQRLGSDHVGN